MLYLLSILLLAEIELGAFRLENMPSGGRLRCRFSICS